MRCGEAAQCLVKEDVQAKRKNMSVPAIIRGCVLLLVRTHTRNMCDRFCRKIHRYFDEMMNTYSKYMIIRYICIHHILIKGYLSMNGKYALPCRFSFGEYSDEKLMSIHAANIQMFICRFIKSSDFHPSSTRLGNGIIGRVPIYCNRSSHFRFQRQR